MPKKVPGLKWILIIYAAAAVVWAVLEGNLGWTVLLGFLTSSILVGWMIQKILGGREISISVWIAAAAFTGLLWGIGGSVFTLFYMALKTGLHAHGPEYSGLEVNWVIQQIPFWAAAGLLGGVGIGLLSSAISRSTS
ncbi:MAG: hypothetical protein R3293_01845 [Candidatus Promineifilaceae bacterium]|nr:hypothetical protein [Candidatus Promineifilaceae bacterium]